MSRVLLFFLLGIPVILISRKSLRNSRNHGFYRFFGWLGIVWMLTGTWKIWFDNFLSLIQIISYIFLMFSILLLVPGIITFMKNGKAHSSRKDEHLFGFEKTTKMVDTGIYKYIRHPMYSSLIFLTWGICFKNPDTENILVASTSTALFIITALYDEKECKEYFGRQYVDYMNRSKRFIPFII